jgi:replicative DNA helicase
MTNVEALGAQAALKAAIAYIEESASYRGVAQSPTGFLQLDHYLRGFRSGEVMLVAARPSMGKSALLMNLVMNTLFESEEPKPVIVATGLTSTTQYALAMLSCYGAIPRDVLRRGDLKDEEWRMLSNGILKLKPLPFYIDDSIRTISELTLKIDHIKETHGVAPIVAIDDIAWLHLKDSEYYERQSQEVVGGLKHIAKSRNASIIFTTNVNSDVDKRENKRPILNDIHHIETYEYMVDKILLLYRDKLYQPNNNKNDIAELRIIKNRMGTIGNVLLQFQGQYAKFLNYSTSNDELLVDE